MARWSTEDHRLRHLLLALMLASAGMPFVRGQLTTGTLKGWVVDESGAPRAGIAITAKGRPASRVETRSAADGEFQFTMPYGEYLLSSSSGTDFGNISVQVAPFRTTCVELLVRSTGPGVVRTRDCSSDSPGVDYPWRAADGREGYVGSDSLHGFLLALEPQTIADPLDFSGLAGMRLPLFSQRAFSWTDVRYTLQGVDATDAYQPGRAALFPDVQALGDVVVRTGLDLGTSPSFGSEIAVFLPEPHQRWHGDLSSSNTGSLLASGNLPAPGSRGAIRQSEQFHWFTRDNLQIGGPLGRRADLFLSGTGQWASQTVPQEPAGNDLKHRLLFGNARGRVQVTDRDLIEGHFSGSRINLSDWGNPAGLEALVGRRMGPSLNATGGFGQLRETDHLDSLQVGWTRQFRHTEHAGALQVRYGFSTAHLDTRPLTAASEQSRMDLARGIVSGAPPFWNLAVRTRQNLLASFEPAPFETFGRRHRVIIGGGWEFAKIRNRIDGPGDLNLITADGAPAFDVQLNTPLDSLDHVVNLSPYVRDEIALTRWLTGDVGVAGDLSRGSLPRQSSPAGNYAQERRFDARSDLIAWNSVSPRAGVAMALPGLRRLVLRGSYARLQDPLAGRYLDFGNPNSLGGVEYQWLDKNGDGLYQPGESGRLLRRFGGPYSSIDGGLKRPYADEFNVAAEAVLPRRSFASVRLFRRDEKHRVAATNTGVTAPAYRPVAISDPGPDFIPGTFDDQILTIYAQDPATFGKDRFLLTNPPDLRMLNTGMIAEAGGRWGRVQTHASFMAVRSYGPTNPGNSVVENDPGVIGALLQDPNTAIHATGRTYFDRAYIGKVQFTARLPKVLGGIEYTNTVDYMDGLVFGRRLLVAGLPEGPFLVATTVRGSPEGGNRAEYVLNWNLRLSRAFTMPRGRVHLALDILNVTNSNNSWQEDDISGPLFNQRLPVAIQPARFLRFDIHYEY